MALYDTTPIERCFVKCEQGDGARMRARKRRRNRTSLYLVMLVAAIFVGTLAVHGYTLRANCQKLAAEQSNLKEKKKELKKEQEEIKEQADYRKTDQYVEDVAREKFGLVYDNEIVFKAKTE